MFRSRIARWLARIGRPRPGKAAEDRVPPERGPAPGAFRLARPGAAEGAASGWLLR